MDQDLQQPQDQNPTPGTFGEDQVPGGAPDEGSQDAGMPPVPAEPTFGGANEGEGAEEAPEVAPEVDGEEVPSDNEEQL